MFRCNSSSYIYAYKTSVILVPLEISTGHQDHSSVTRIKQLGGPKFLLTKKHDSFFRVKTSSAFSAFCFFCTKRLILILNTSIRLAPLTRRLQYWSSRHGKLHNSKIAPPPPYGLFAPSCTNSKANNMRTNLSSCTNSKAKNMRTNFFENFRHTMSEGYIQRNINKVHFAVNINSKR